MTNMDDWRRTHKERRSVLPISPRLPGIRLQKQECSVGIMAEIEVRHWQRWLVKLSSPIVDRIAIIT